MDLQVKKNENLTLEDDFSGGGWEVLIQDAERNTIGSRETYRSINHLVVLSQFEIPMSITIEHYRPTSLAALRHPNDWDHFQNTCKLLDSLENVGRHADEILGKFHLIFDSQHRLREHIDTSARTKVSRL